MSRVLRSQGAALGLEELRIGQGLRRGYVRQLLIGLFGGSGHSNLILRSLRRPNFKRLKVCGAPLLFETPSSNAEVFRSSVRWMGSRRIKSFQLWQQVRLPECSWDSLASGSCSKGLPGPSVEFGIMILERDVFSVTYRTEAEPFMERLREPANLAW